MIIKKNGVEISTTTTGGDIQNTICILLPHDGSPDPFLRAHPEYLKACPQREHIRTLIEIHRDKGTSILADHIEDEVLKKTEKYRIQILKVLVPRMVIDLNRVKPQDAIRHTFDHQIHRDLFRKLQSIHSQIFKELNKNISQLQEGDILLDLHSMGPCNAPFVELTPNSTKKTIDTWSQEYPGQKREIDIIDAYNSGNDENKAYGDSVLNHFLEKELNDHDYGSKRGVPYNAIPWLVGNYWNQVAKLNGVIYGAIDIPKDIICDIPRNVENGRPLDLANAEPSEEKCAEIATPLASALIRRLEPQHANANLSL